MTTHLFTESGLGDSVEKSKQLWDKVLQSGYLKLDTYDRIPDTFTPLITEIRSYLRTEQVKYEDRPNAIHTIAHLLTSLSGAGGKTGMDSLIQAFLEKGLVLAALELEESKKPKLSPEHPASASLTEAASVLGETLARISAAIEEDGKSYVAGTGPYSSIYAALLAILLDEITIRMQLDSLASQLEIPSTRKLLTGPVMKPGPLFWTTYYRGQCEDWPLLPKLFRQPKSPEGIIGRLYWRFRELFANAKFSAALSQVIPPALNSEKIEAIQQHYGFRTSLLDFTTNIQVAAFFATRSLHSGGNGVIYRYHLAHPYALHLLESLKSTLDLDGTRLAGQRKNIVTSGLRALKLVYVEGVDRISRQKGVFIKGWNLWAAHNFFQPIYFRQHEGIVYDNAKDNITEDWLFPKDDPIEKIAAPIRDSLKGWLTP